MTDDDPDCGALRDIKDRVARQGEETLAKVIEELLESPFVRNAMGQALDARDKASRAQETAFGLLNIPSASDIERLTRRVRSLSQRMEGIEDAVDRIAERLGGIDGAGGEAGLRAIEARLESIATDLAALRAAAAPPSPRAAAKPTAKPSTRAKAASPPRKP